MNSVAISLRYAKALFSLAKEKNLLNDVYDDLSLIYTVLKPSKEFSEIITSPVVKESKKINLFTNVFKDVVNPISLNFLIFLVNKNRENYLFDIIRNFGKIYREENNIKEIYVYTPIQINDAIKEKLTTIVKNLFDGASSEFHDQIDNDMIGGIKVRIDNLLLDMSIKTQLEEIRKTLKSEAYMYKA